MNKKMNDEQLAKKRARDAKYRAKKRAAKVAAAVPAKVDTPNDTAKKTCKKCKACKKCAKKVAATVAPVANVSPEERLLRAVFGKDADKYMNNRPTSVSERTAYDSVMRAHREHRAVNAACRAVCNAMLDLLRVFRPDVSKIVIGIDNPKAPAKKAPAKK